MFILKVDAFWELFTIYMLLMCKIMARFLKTSVSELVSCMALQYFIFSHTSYILSIIYPFLVFWVSEGKNKHPSKT